MSLKDKLALEWHSLDDVLKVLPKPPKGNAREHEDRVRATAEANGLGVDVGGDLHFTESDVLGLVEAMKPRPTVAQAATEVATSDEPGWVVFLSDLDSRHHQRADVVMVWAKHGEVDERTKSLVADMGLSIVSIGVCRPSLFNYWRSLLRGTGAGGSKYALSPMIDIMMELCVESEDTRPDAAKVHSARHC